MGSHSGHPRLWKSQSGTMSIGKSNELHGVREEPAGVRVPSGCSLAASPGLILPASAAPQVACPWGQAPGRGPGALEATVCSSRTQPWRRWHTLTSQLPQRLGLCPQPERLPLRPGLVPNQHECVARLHRVDASPCYLSYFVRVSVTVGLSS